MPGSAPSKGSSLAGRPQRSLMTVVWPPMALAIDDSGHHEFAGGVNYRGARGNCDVRAYRGDLAVTNQNRTMLDGPVGDGENGGVSNYGDARRLRASRGRNEHREQRREANH